MKLVVDIPEDYYKAIKEIPVEQSTGDMMIIHNGTPLKKLDRRMEKELLDKIRAEIDAHREKLKIMADDDWYAGKIRGYDCAIEIIDKYRAEGSEE